MNALLLLAAALLLSPLAEAAESPQWVVLGIGTDSCASYTLALDADRPTAAIKMDVKVYYTTANAYAQWLSGFVTAANMSGPEDLKYQINVDVNGVALWVKNYCVQYPSEPIVAAAGAFVRAHRKAPKK